MTGNNHPNRNWRRVMHEAADAHLAAYQRPEAGMQAIPINVLREIVRTAFVAGYEAGRQSTQRKKT